MTPRRVGNISTSNSTARKRPPVKRKSTKKPDRRLLWTALIAVLVIVSVIVTILIINSGADTAEEKIKQDAKFAQGVSVEGKDISGLTYDKALDKLSAVIQEKIDQMKIEFTVQGHKASMTPIETGIVSNLEDVLKEALLYQGKEDKDFTVSYSADQDTIKSSISKGSDEWNVAAKSAQVVVNTFADEDKKSTSAKITYEEEQVGYSVVEDELATTVEQKIQSQDFSAFEAPVEEVQPKYTVDYFKENLNVIGQYTSEFDHSPLNKAGRVYNIWKMADVVNGVKIEPGETWSMNDEAGDRTEANGWALASGIENGVTQDVPGGGICQVSSTLYNAALRAELDIVERKHHSWPSDYMPMGLDATISTGSPDLKLKNEYATSIYLIASVDGPSQSITVKVYGLPVERDYTLKFRSEVVKTVEPGEPTVEQNDELEPGTQNTVRSAKKGYVVDVYKDYYDKDGKLIKSDKMYQDYYKAYAAIVEQGPEIESPSPSPSESPEQTDTESPADSSVAPSDSQETSKAPADTSTAAQTEETKSPAASKTDEE